MRTTGNGDVELLRVRANCLLAMGEIENAFRHLQQAMKSDPDNTKIRALYRTVKELQEKKTAGDDAFKRSDWGEAITQWTDCIQLAKDSPSYLAKLHFNRGTALTKQQKHEDAVRDCSKAIFYNAEYTKAYIRRGDSYLAMGEPENIQKSIRYQMPSVFVFQYDTLDLWCYCSFIFVIDVLFEFVWNDVLPATLKEIFCKWEYSVPIERCFISLFHVLRTDGTDQHTNSNNFSSSFVCFLSLLNYLLSYFI